MVSELGRLGLCHRRSLCFISRARFVGCDQILKSESDSSRGVAVTGAQTFRQLLENEPALARLHNFAFSAPFLGLGEDMSTAAPSDIEVSAPGTENAGAEPPWRLQLRRMTTQTRRTSPLWPRPSRSDAARENIEGTSDTADPEISAVDVPALDSDASEARTETQEGGR